MPPTLVPSSDPNSQHDSRQSLPSPFSVHLPNTQTRSPATCIPVGNSRASSPRWQDRCTPCSWAAASATAPSSSDRSRSTGTGRRRAADAAPPCSRWRRRRCWACRPCRGGCWSSRWTLRLSTRWSVRWGPLSSHHRVPLRGSWGLDQQDRRSLLDVSLDALCFYKVEMKTREGRTRSHWGCSARRCSQAQAESSGDLTWRSKRVPREEWMRTRTWGSSFSERERNQPILNAKKSTVDQRQDQSHSPAGLFRSPFFANFKHRSHPLIRDSSYPARLERFLSFVAVEKQNCALPMWYPSRTAYWVRPLFSKLLSFHRSWKCSNLYARWI